MASGKKEADSVLTVKQKACVETIRPRTLTRNVVYGAQQTALMAMRCMMQRTISCMTATTELIKGTHFANLADLYRFMETEREDQGSIYNICYVHKKCIRCRLSLKESYHTRSCGERVCDECSNKKHDCSICAVSTDDVSLLDVTTDIGAIDESFHKQEKMATVQAYKRDIVAADIGTSDESPPKVQKVTVCEGVQDKKLT